MILLLLALTHTSKQRRTNGKQSYGYENEIKLQNKNIADMERDIESHAKKIRNLHKESKEQKSQGSTWYYENDGGDGENDELSTK